MNVEQATGQQTKSTEQGVVDLSLAESALLNFVKGVPAVSLSQVEQIAELATQLSASSCEVEIINGTNLCWVPHSHFARHGQFASGMHELPAVAPIYVDNTGRTEEFSAAAISESQGLHAPTTVMIWQALNSDLYLIAYADIWKRASNDGYFGLTTTDPGTAQAWYNANKSTTYNYGGIGKKCNSTVGGVKIAGTMTDDTHAALKLNLS